MPNLFEYREYIYYCPKCGNFYFITYGSDGLCLICKTNMLETPHDYNLTQHNWMHLPNEEWKQNEQRLFDEVISKSPEFDINLYNSKDSILKQRQQQQEEAIAHGQAILEGRDKGNQFGVECPYCHATNVKKITMASKAVHTVFFGIFSLGRNSKQWHCNHCNSDF